MNISEIINKHKMITNTNNYDSNINNDNSNDGDMFLSFLENDKYVPSTEIEKTEKQYKEYEKENEKQNKKLKADEREKQRIEKEKERNENKIKKDELKRIKEKDLNDPKRNEIIKKINHYKILFPEIKLLKSIKIAKNASIDDLNQILVDCENILQVNTIEEFIDSAILQTIKMGEKFTVKTKYNITGLSNTLKSNENFMKLSKQLYLKYGSNFSEIPIEVQMLLIVATSTWICIEKNKNSYNNLDEIIDDDVMNHLESV